jgi:hypothetical protein
LDVDVQRLTGAECIADYETNMCAAGILDEASYEYPREEELNKD